MAAMSVTSPFKTGDHILSPYLLKISTIFPREASIPNKYFVARSKTFICCFIRILVISRHGSWC